MALQRYRTMLIIVGVALAFFIVSPLIQQYVATPQTQLTEIWLLGPKHDTLYPTNVTSDQHIQLYVVVANHLGSSAQYQTEIKFRAYTQSAPNSFNQTPSDQPALERKTFSLANNVTQEIPIDVSFNYTVSENPTRKLLLHSITINGHETTLDQTIPYDASQGGFFGNLFIELYLYNTTSETYVYNQRYVSLRLNMLP
ncbi:MAG: DUF1616 domain-containing protein [Candidatus Bathyarchaeota archaeon]|nr:DUF1616 domain-containing protein [Candidatus Bathyarchaeota archaeon]